MGIYCKTLRAAVVNAENATEGGKIEIAQFAFAYNVDWRQENRLSWEPAGNYGRLTGSLLAKAEKAREKIDAEYAVECIARDHFRNSDAPMPVFKRNNRASYYDSEYPGEIVGELVKINGRYVFHKKVD